MYNNHALVKIILFFYSNICISATVYPNPDLSPCALNYKLTITGKDNSVTLFSDVDFDKMPRKLLKTDNYWSNKKINTYSGVYLSDLLKIKNIKFADSDLFYMYAYDNFTIILKAHDVIKYNPLLADKENQINFNKSDKGPLWLMFSQPKLKMHGIDGEHPVWRWKYIWQLCKINIVGSVNNSFQHHHQ